MPNTSFLSPEDIETIFSRTRIPPPKEILVPLNAQIVNESGPYAGRKVLGMHLSGENSIFVPATSPTRTVLHESVHNMGFRGETITRIIAAISDARCNYGIIPRIRGHRRRIRYDVQELSPDEVNGIMEKYGLSGNGMRIFRMTLRGE